MRTILIAAALLAGTASNATADWQYTRWGMSVEELDKVLGNKALLFHDKEGNSAGKIRRFTSYQAGSLSFRARFRFLDNRLTQVELELLNSSCAVLKSEAGRKYGVPQDKLGTKDHDTIDIDRWFIPATEEAVSYAAMASSTGARCWMTYTKTADPEAASGL